MFTVSEMRSADPQIPICDTAGCQGSGAAIQASDSPNYFHPNCQTFPKKVLSVAVGLSKVLTCILNKQQGDGIRAAENWRFSNLQCQSQEFDQYMR